MDSKVIIVTGGKGDIGSVICKGFLDNNEIVYCIDKNLSKGSNLGKYDNYYEIENDITDIKAVKETIEHIVNKHKKIDVLINNAGITIPNNSSDHYSIDDFKQTLGVNIIGSYICCYHVFPIFKSNCSGVIINITSLNAELAFPNNPGYVSSKGGLKMMSKALALDWGKYNIRVNNVGPGYIKTEMTQKSYNDPIKNEERKKRTMLNRWGTPDDLLGVILFLASDEAKYITGQDIYVDGGWLYKGL